MRALAGEGGGARGAPASGAPARHTEAPARSAGAPAGDPRDRARSAVVLLAVAAVILAVLGAALAGPWEAAPRPAGEVPLPPAASQEAVTPEAVEPPLVTAEGGGGIHPLALVVAALVVLGALLARWLVGRATFARGGTVVGHETAGGRQVDVATEPEVEPDLPALRRGVDAAQAALASAGKADDVVIAAWLELEAAASSSGVPRAPAQTPTEFTTAVLDATAADPAATRTLLGLYHRARFGRGEAGRMGKAEVATATECLRRLAASWPATSSQAARPPQPAPGEAAP
ncbi:DUF4129 domain-containing protein [Georgenia wangjunii]|uniref:DUF4129 domain-containing protein n=1 Tax=Georgenia wangjunii TaxID=3117730 RepID=UPI002F265F9D